MPLRAHVIVDLGFGDAGKGFLTDFLVRRTGAQMVVRYNGGAQAGHNVVTSDGRHHTFAQFGAGTFVPGVRTFLSRNVVIHPTALLRENEHLSAAGVTDALDRLSISGDALVITPYHQALCRLREIARGAARHGSCGVGVGEAVDYARTHGNAIRARDLGDVTALRRQVLRVRDYVRAEVDRLALRDACAEMAVLDRADVLDDWCAAVRPVAKLVGGDDDWFSGSPNVIFEGAQGVLLDEAHGFPPYTTWGTCTAAPALAMLAQAAADAEVATIGVLRTHAVRHGPGPLPTEDPNVPEVMEHNAFNQWQGRVRRGWFDAVLARRALSVAGGVDALAVTHLDWLAHLPRWRYCDAYDDRRPLFRDCPATEEDVLRTIEEALGKRVMIGSRGPTADDGFVRLAEVKRGLDRRSEMGRSERPARVALPEHRAVDHDPRLRE